MKSFLEEIILEKLQLAKLPQDQREAVLLQIGQEIYERVNMRALEDMPEADQEELNKILTEKPDDEDALLSFMRNKVPNLEEIIREEVEGFQKESADFLDNLSK